MKCKLIFNDWRKIGEAESIYNTELGIELSLGDLHSGSTFEADVILTDEIESDLKEAIKNNKAYAVFSVLPNVD